MRCGNLPSLQGILVQLSSMQTPSLTIQCPQRVSRRNPTMHALPVRGADDCEPTYTRTPRSANTVSVRMAVSARVERHRRGGEKGLRVLGSCPRRNLARIIP